MMNKSVAMTGVARICITIKCVVLVTLVVTGWFLFHSVQLTVSDNHEINSSIVKNGYPSLLLNNKTSGDKFYDSRMDVSNTTTGDLMISLYSDTAHFNRPNYSSAPVTISNNPCLYEMNKSIECMLKAPMLGIVYPLPKKDPSL